MKPGIERLAWGAVIFMAGLIVGVVVITLSNRTRPAPIIINPPPATVTPLPTETPPPLRVHISGQVARPDVYELTSGAILQDAIEAAGGFAEGANQEVINLALPLNDGMHVHVPDLESQLPLDVRSGSGLSEPLTSSGPINLNTATSAELEQLPGIGPSIAQKVIDYRQTNGPFTAIEEIQNVSGIGPAKIEQIKEQIVVK